MEKTDRAYAEYRDAITPIRISFLFLFVIS